jgi:hypothetical protein
MSFLNFPFFDKKPPVVAGGFAHTLPGLYASEIMGRYVFLDVSSKFLLHVIT